MDEMENISVFFLRTATSKKGHIVRSLANWLVPTYVCTVWIVWKYDVPFVAANVLAWICLTLDDGGDLTRRVICTLSRRENIHFGARCRNFITRVLFSNSLVILFSIRSRPEMLRGWDTNCVMCHLPFSVQRFLQPDRVCHVFGTTLTPNNWTRDGIFLICNFRNENLISFGAENPFLCIIQSLKKESNSHYFHIDYAQFVISSFIGQVTLILHFQIILPLPLSRKRLTNSSCWANWSVFYVFDSMVLNARKSLDWGGTVFIPFCIHSPPVSRSDSMQAKILKSQGFCCYFLINSTNWIERDSFQFISNEWAPGTG